MIASGDCARAARLLGMVSETTGSDPLADAESLIPCTRKADEETARVAWAVIGEAYRNALGEYMQAEPRKLREAVALARRTLEIPEAYRSESVTDYARYVLQVSNRQATATVDAAKERLERLDACTQTLSTIEWKRRREDESYLPDLQALRAHCCSFLRANLADWIAWMESDPETTDDRGRTVRRQFTAQEISNKQTSLDRYCSDR
jgi:hypothetical protein